ncbi:MAG TPA: hypothetical protein VIK48_01445, partial [Candidatus Manganitrophaceae bacterium]
MILTAPGWEASSDAADVFLGTSRSGFEKISIAVLPFQGGTESAERILLAETVLQSDLARSQVFKVVEPSKINLSGMIGPPPPQAVIKASAAGVQAVAWAKLYPRGEEWILESYAYETGKGEQVVGVKIVGDAKSIRAMAHRFSDKLVSYFTGETGIAQTKIAYVSDLTGKKEVYLMDYDGANVMRVTGDQSIVISPRWSFDAGQIGYTSYREGNPDIYFLDLGTGKRRKAVSFPGLNFSASWSPAGDRVAFTTTKDGDAEIYVMRPDGSDLKRLTFNAADDLSPVWSPTGKQIAFTSDRGGSPQIYIMDADGSNVHRLTFSGDYNTSPAWSPKGDWIAYACRDDEKRLKICADRADGEQS